jgi:hypothetical protein
MKRLSKNTPPKMTTLQLKLSTVMLLSLGHRDQKRAKQE